MESTTTTAPNGNAPTFRIGTVSRMTDIPVDTLRAWERRYGVVKPDRSDGSDRLYKQADIHRLSLLKKLIDRGHSIGSIARLSDNALNDRLELHECNLLVDSSHGPLRVAVLGDVLPLRIGNGYNIDKGINYVGLHSYATEFEAALQKEKPDVIVLEYASLHKETLQDIKRYHRQSQARHTFILYGFASHTVIESLDPSQFSAIQAPKSLLDLQLAIKRVLANKTPETQSPMDDNDNGPAPCRLFTNKALVDASMATTSVRCECPQHLSTIIQKLVQFEIYSAECENRNDEDAKLHAYLKNVTGHARSLVEQALEHVIKAENLDIETTRQQS